MFKIQLNKYRVRKREIERERRKRVRQNEMVIAWWQHTIENLTKRQKNSEINVSIASFLFMCSNQHSISETVNTMMWMRLKLHQPLTRKQTNIQQSFDWLLKARHNTNTIAPTVINWEKEASKEQTEKMRRKNCVNRFPNQLQHKLSWFGCCYN